MTEAEQEPRVTDEKTLFAAPRTGMALAGLIIRTIARLWVVCLLLVGAAFAGITLNQMMQRQAQLNELRKEPGPDAYAVVAYQRELERQIRAYNQNWRSESVPTPPPRPRLLEDIDLARLRNREISQGSAPSAAPTDGVISAPP